ncbi:MAG: alpha/beta fold hydrolase, partial [Candidatus Binataceae bacterium]
LDWGGDGSPILILHATGFLGRVYRPIAEALRSLGRVYSYDQLGHGGSDTPRLDEISWYRTADDLEGVLETMGLRGVRAFGHSAGATAIAAIADRRPDLIARAMLVEPVIVDQADPLERPSELYQRTLKRKPAFDSLAEMYANFASKPGYSSWRPDILRDYCEHGTRPDGGERRVLRCTPEIEAQLYQTARDFDGLHHLLACTIPMLVVFGEKSDSPGLGFAERITRDAPRRRVVVVPGGGHLLPMEQPDEIARLAVDFFSGA